MRVTKKKTNQTILRNRKGLTQIDQNKTPGVKKSKCEWCGYETFVVSDLFSVGMCMSCGFGFADKPILHKDAAKKRKKNDKGS